MISSRTSAHDRVGRCDMNELSSGSPPARTLITISIPVLNEEDNIAPLLARLDDVSRNNPQYGFEFLFTDNASTDNTFAKLAEAAADDSRIRVLRFSRNY